MYDWTVVKVTDVSVSKMGDSRYEELAAELVIANKKLVFDNEEKEKRADELVLANIEKDKRAIAWGERHARTQTNR